MLTCQKQSLNILGNHSLLSAKNWNQNNNTLFTYNVSSKGHQNKNTPLSSPKLITLYYSVIYSTIVMRISL